MEGFRNSNMAQGCLNKLKQPSFCREAIIFMQSSHAWCCLQFKTNWKVFIYAFSWGSGFQLRAQQRCEDYWKIFREFDMFSQTFVCKKSYGVVSALLSTFCRSIVRFILLQKIVISWEKLRLWIKLFVFIKNEEINFTLNEKTQLKKT